MTDGDAWLQPLKLAKIAFLVALTGVTIWQVYTNAINYAKNDVVTSVSTEPLDSIEFPQVTICNYNRYKSSLVTTEAISEIYAAYAAYAKANGQQSASNSSGPERGLDVYNFTYAAGWHLIDDFNSNQFPQHNKTLLACSYQGRLCGSKLFKHKMTKYGNCYTFNKDITSEDLEGLYNWNAYALPLTQNHASETNGLVLYINVEANDYSESSLLQGSPLIGLKVIIHSATEEPDPVAKGFSINPGYVSTVSLKKYKFENLGPPYGKCTSNKTLQYYQRYSTSACGIECKLAAVDSYCSCRPYFYPKTTTMCDIGDTLLCAEPVIAAIDNNFSAYCQCPSPCNYDDYLATVSNAAFPSRLYESEFVEYFNVPNITYLRENVAGLKIYFSEIGYTTASQSPTYTTISILNDIGGTLGLYLGVSFLTLFEIVEYFVDIFKNRALSKSNAVHSIRKQSTVDHIAFK